MSEVRDSDQFRPIGWWLKEADRRLEAAFHSGLQAAGLPSRRSWQVLASVARGTATPATLTDQLSGFDSAENVQALIEQLQAQGWLTTDGDRLELTPEGSATYEAAAGAADQIRAKVAAALPDDDYQVLIDLLGRLVAAFPTDRQAAGSP